MPRLLFNGPTGARRRFRIVPYNMGSNACKQMSKELGVLRVASANKSRFVARDTDILINWGFSGPIPDHLSKAEYWVNNPSLVRRASNKRLCFETLRSSGIPTPDFTTSQTEAENWLNGESLEDDEEGKPCDIVCRHTLTGHSGEGIEIVDRVNTVVDKNKDYVEDDFKLLPTAPLYVKYVPKKHEYRVHVLPGGSTIIRQKLRDTSVSLDDVDWRVRSHGNGFIFAQELSFKPEGIEKLGEDAVDSLGLEFGAVDIIYNEKRNRMFVLEVNTAPGLEGSTVEYYKEAFKSFLGL